MSCCFSCISESNYILIKNKNNSVITKNKWAFCIVTFKWRVIQYANIQLSLLLHVHRSKGWHFNRVQGSKALAFVTNCNKFKTTSYTFPSNEREVTAHYLHKNVKFILVTRKVSSILYQFSSHQLMPPKSLKGLHI